MNPRVFTYQSMGTQWRMTFWDDMDDALFTRLQEKIIQDSREFDRAYSRFKKDSLIWTLTQARGVTEVPVDMVKMLRLYEKLHRLSGGKCNPLVGFALSDLGYDAEYSLKTKDVIRPVPPLTEALTIVDDTHIDLRESVLIDLGALGKGFFVDKIAAFLHSEGLKRYLVDGSGDMLYRGNGEKIRVGLEHPGDATKVVGVVEMTGGAMCGSASNRRRWGKYHHTIDPTTLTSPSEIIATWVVSGSAALSDGLATCLFLTPPELYTKTFDFEYCILHKDYKIKRSAGFAAELF